MELVEACSPIDSSRLPPAKSSEIALRGLRGLYQMIFRDGFVHADLHPGNILVSPQGDLWMLDCGLATELTDTVREQFRQLFWSLAMGDGLHCASIVLETARKVPSSFDRKAFDASIEALVCRFSRQCVMSFEVAGFASGLFATQRRFGIRGSPAFTMTIYAVLVYDGILKDLAPALDFQRAAVESLLKLPDANGRLDRAAVFSALENSVEHRYAHGATD